MLDSRLNHRIRHLGVKSPESPTSSDLNRIFRANLKENRLSTSDLNAYLSAVRPVAEVLCDACRIALNEWAQAGKSYRETLQEVIQTCNEKLASGRKAEQDIWWDRIGQLFDRQREEADKDRTTVKTVVTILSTALVVIVAIAARGLGGGNDGFSGEGLG